jgi:STE24 endopeptidase
MELFPMNAFTVMFLIALAAAFGIEHWLSRRQMAHVRAHRSEVPQAFQGTISLEAHQKAADYTIEKARLGNVDRVLGTIVLLLLTVGGGIGAVQDIWGHFELASLVTGVGVILTTLFVIQLLELPISLYQTFIIEERYGFNRTTPRQFVIDLGLQWLLGLALGIPLLSLILWIMNGMDDYWWLLAWATVMGFSILISWAFPTVIAPLFNKFTPLPDEVLKKRIESLLARCGFHSKGIFVMDGSRRSGHGNAYFTGIGDSKRIVFFDTLMNALEHDELEAVLAHELGHFKRKHVLKMLLASAVMSLIGFAVLGWVSGQDWFYSGLGVELPSKALALLLFMLVAPVFTVFLRPISAYFQRRYEFEADDFAAAYTKPTHLISALVKLYRENASTLTPDPLYSAFHYSHPPAAVRIAHLAAKVT